MTPCGKVETTWGGLQDAENWLRWFFKMFSTIYPLGDDPIWRTFLETKQVSHEKNLLTFHDSPYGSNHLVRWWLGCPSSPRNERYLGSMKPFSEGEPGSLGTGCLITKVLKEASWLKEDLDTLRKDRIFGIVQLSSSPGSFGPIWRDFA